MGTSTADRLPKQKPGSIFKDKGFHITINEAYAIQDTIVKLRLQKGETIAGYKVGCTDSSIPNFLACGGQFA